MCSGNSKISSTKFSGNTCFHLDIRCFPLIQIVENCILLLIYLQRKDATCAILKENIIIARCSVAVLNFLGKLISEEPTIRTTAGTTMTFRKHTFRRRILGEELIVESNIFISHVFFSCLHCLLKSLHTHTTFGGFKTHRLSINFILLKLLCLSNSRFQVFSNKHGGAFL